MPGTPNSSLTAHPPQTPPKNHHPKLSLCLLQHPLEPGRGGRGSQWPLSRAGPSPVATGRSAGGTAQLCPLLFTPFLCIKAHPRLGGIPSQSQLVACAALGVPGHPSARAWHPKLILNSPPTRNTPQNHHQSSPCVSSFLQHPLEPGKGGRGSQWPLSRAGPSPVATGQLEAQPSFTPLFLPGFRARALAQRDPFPVAALGVPGHPGCQGLARDPPAHSSQPIHQLPAPPAPGQLGSVQSHSLKVKHLFQLPEPSTSSQPAIPASQDLWWLDYLGMSFFHAPVSPRGCFCLSQIPLHPPLLPLPLCQRV
ncbi:uncharacterized protein LOC134553723 [Prinia subflava]|uniref:uncharacterized protein LOC134553723 n=1 Tax=Prinia subflava TaxID=208062 RepID=UPI002FE3B3CD